MSRHQQGGLPPNENSLYDATSESRLFRHVLLRAFNDCIYGTPQAKLEIIDWIDDLDGADDFGTVCHYAATNKGFMASLLWELLSAPKAAALVRASEARRVIMMKDGERLDAEERHRGGHARGGKTRSG